MGSVVVLTAEDDLCDTVVPRLSAMGADGDRVVLMEGFRFDGCDGGEGCGTVVGRPRRRGRVFDLGRDLAELERVFIDRPEVKLLVIDPVVAFMGKVDGNRNKDVLNLLLNLAHLAGEYDVSVLAVTHLNKGESGIGGSGGQRQSRLLYRAIGSLGFTAASRSVLMVMSDPYADGRRVVVPVKNNLSCENRGLAYRLEGAGDGGVVVKWEDELFDIDLDELIGGNKAREDRLVNGLEGWLLGQLQDGPRDAIEVIASAQQMGVTANALRKLKEGLGVESFRIGFASSGKWIWGLPGRLGEYENPMNRMQSSPH